jgi:hypothetical protein
MTGLFRRLHDGVPFSTTAVYLPLMIGRRIAESGVLVIAGEVLP